MIAARLDVDQSPGAGLHRVNLASLDFVVDRLATLASGVTGFGYALPLALRPNLPDADPLVSRHGVNLSRYAFIFFMTFPFEVATGDGKNRRAVTRAMSHHATVVNTKQRGG
jgi:hypothetical protein